MQKLKQSLLKEEVIDACFMVVQTGLRKYIYDQWSRAVKRHRAEWSPPQPGTAQWRSSFVCSDHFEPQHYRSMSNRLKDDAVPVNFWKSNDRSTQLRKTKTWQSNVCSSLSAMMHTVSPSNDLTSSCLPSPHSDIAVSASSSAHQSSNVPICSSSPSSNSSAHLNLSQTVVDQHHPNPFGCTSASLLNSIPVGSTAADTLERAHLSNRDALEPSSSTESLYTSILIEPECDDNQSASNIPQHFNVEEEFTKFMEGIENLDNTLDDGSRNRSPSPPSHLTFTELVSQHGASETYSEEEHVPDDCQDNEFEMSQQVQTGEMCALLQAPLEDTVVQFLIGKF